MGARRITRNWHVAVFLLPALAAVGIFYIVPNLANLYLAFTDWSAFSSDINFVGLGNFQDLLANGLIFDALSKSVTYALLVMVVQNVIGLTLALVLEGPTRFNVFFRAVFFVPVLISSLAAGYVAKAILEPGGPFDQLLNAISQPFGLGAVEIDWFGDPGIALYVVAMVTVWTGLGINMMVFSAGLVAIPREVVEAARVEGAGPWQVIRKVKVPLLGPALTFNIAFTLIQALAAFDVIMATTKGGPAQATQVLNIAVWQQFGYGHFSYSAAISQVLLIAITAIAIPVVIYLRRREVEL